MVVCLEMDAYIDNQLEVFGLAKCMRRREFFYFVLVETINNVQLL